MEIFNKAWQSSSYINNLLDEAHFTDSSSVDWSFKTLHIAEMLKLINKRNKIGTEIETLTNQMKENTNGERFSFVSVFSNEKINLDIIDS